MKNIDARNAYFGWKGNHVSLSGRWEV